MSIEPSTYQALLKFEAMPPNNNPLDDNAVVVDGLRDAVANTYRIKKSTRKSHPGKSPEVLYM